MFDLHKTLDEKENELYKEMLSKMLNELRPLMMRFKLHEIDLVDFTKEAALIGFKAGSESVLTLSNEVIKNLL